MNNKHGLRHHPLYRIWGAMKERCYNVNNKRYKDWGGRGITVCDEWYHNAKTFIDWCLDNGYKKGLQIDRIDNDKEYSPNNCRWVSMLINSNNRRGRKDSSLPIGLERYKNKYRARLCKLSLGIWDTVEEASKQYQCTKRVYVALLSWSFNLK